ncbi:MAG: hypothetical protein AB8B72_03825 [Crocinitomicaceae bacterium]
MKNILLAIAATIAISQTQAQGQEIARPENSSLGLTHEIGLDATSFIKYFTTFNNTDFFTPTNPTYQFTYRLKSKYGNVRFGAGGNYSEQEFQNNFIGDSTVRKRMNNALNIRIGYELKTDISKRWQAFYGIDFRPSYQYFRDDAVQYNFEYVVGQEIKSKILGVAPLLGFRFKATPRLSLTTEASFPVNFVNTTTRTYFAARFDGVPFREDDEIEGLKSVFGQFNPPISLIVTFDL